MTALAKRKTRLSFATSATVSTPGTKTIKTKVEGEPEKRVIKHLRVDRPIVAEVHPEYVVLRLAGQRHKLEVSWRGIYDFAARVTAEKARAERKLRRRAR